MKQTDLQKLLTLFTHWWQLLVEIVIRKYKVDYEQEKVWRITKNEWKNEWNQVLLNMRKRNCPLKSFGFYGAQRDEKGAGINFSYCRLKGVIFKLSGSEYSSGVWGSRGPKTILAVGLWRFRDCSRLLCGEQLMYLMRRCPTCCTV